MTLGVNICFGGLREQEVLVSHLPEHLLRDVKRELKSERVRFTGRGEREVVMRLLSDFEESIARMFDRPRAKQLTLTERSTVEVILAKDIALARQKRAENTQLQLRRWRKGFHAVMATLEVETIIHESFDDVGASKASSSHKEADDDLEGVGISVGNTEEGPISSRRYGSSYSTPNSERSQRKQPMRSPSAHPSPTKPKQPQPSLLERTPSMVDFTESGINRHHSAESAATTAEYV